MTVQNSVSPRAVAPIRRGWPVRAQGGGVAETTAPDQVPIGVAARYAAAGDIVEVDQIGTTAVATSAPVGSVVRLGSSGEAAVDGTGAAIGYVVSRQGGYARVALGLLGAGVFGGGGGDAPLVPLVQIDNDSGPVTIGEEFGSSWLLTGSETVTIPDSTSLPQWAQDAPAGTQFVQNVFGAGGLVEFDGPDVVLFPHIITSDPYLPGAGDTIVWTKTDGLIEPIVWYGVVVRTDVEAGTVPVQYIGVSSEAANAFGTSVDVLIGYTGFNPFEQHIVGVIPETTGDTVDVTVEVSSLMVCPNIPDTAGIPMRYRVSIAMEDDAKLGTLAVRVLDGSTITVPYTKYTSGTVHDGIELDITVYSDNSDEGMVGAYRETGIAYHTVRVVSVSRVTGGP